ncbi:MAG: hypothetical protein ACRDTE_15030 [Pseudonocardiaceae bacterium]
MSFTVDDEDAFHARRDELVADLAAWLAASNVTEVDSGDAAVALDWKWGYQDGELGRWTVGDLDEFLLEWCPRKLSLAPEHCAGFPNSIRAFLTFLADRGLLAPGSGTLSQLQRCCERNTSRFVTKMADPANYGLAKGHFARAGGLQPGVDLDDEDTVAALMERMQGLPPEALKDLGISGITALPTTADETLPILTVGPVEPPDPAQRAESAAAAPALAQLNQLWQFCAAPGRPLTQKGNLRLADVRHLVDVLQTGDRPDVEIGDHRRTLRSIEDLPVLSRLVELAIDARVLRRHQGRLVAVARWRELSPVQAIDRLVHAAVEAGLSGPLPPYLSWLADVQDFVDEGAGRLLAELLDWRAAGKPLPIDELCELMVQAVSEAFGGLDDADLGLVRRWVRDQLDRLVALGIVTVRDVQQVSGDWDIMQAQGGVAELTPAGVPVAVRLAEELGIIVLTRPDPATATARDLVDLLAHLEPAAWFADTSAWVTHRGAEQAAQEIADALNDDATPAPVALAVLTQLDALLGASAVPAVETLLGGRHDGFAVQWLVGSGALDPATVEPDRLLRAGIDVLAVSFDVGGPHDLIDALATVNADRDAQLGVIDRIWRVDHPRVAELLEAIGEHHPDKHVAKPARKSLLRHRSWMAGRQA